MEFNYQLINDCIFDIFTSYQHDCYFLFQLSLISSKISSFFHSLKHIKINYSEISILNKFLSLQSIDIFSSNMDNSKYLECSRLKDLTNLTSLRLGDSFMIENISCLTLLQKIELDICDYRLRYFYTCTNLVFLTYLKSNTNGYVSYFDRLTNLKYFKGLLHEIDVNFNHCKSLEYLNVEFILAGNLLFDVFELKHLTHVKLASSISGQVKCNNINFNTNLRILKMFHINIINLDVRPFLFLEKLTLHQLISIDGIIISGLNHLKKLYLHNIETIRIYSLTSLLRLKISQIQILTFMGNFGNLTHLTINNVRIFPESLRITSLKKLSTDYYNSNMYRNLEVDFDGVENCKIKNLPIFELSNMTNLTSLSVKSNCFLSLNLTHMKYLRKLTILYSMKNLKVNKIVDVMKIRDDMIIEHE